LNVILTNLIAPHKKLINQHPTRATSTEVDRNRVTLLDYHR